jgi:hypothetical protein
VFQVTANRDLETFDPPEMLSDGGRVEQCLRGMLACPVARIDDRAFHDCRNSSRGSAGAVADNQRVGPHCVKRPRRIFQRLALLDRAMLDRHRHHLRAEAIAGYREAHERSRRILEEGIDDGEAIQPAIVAPRLAIIGEPPFARVEDGCDLGVAQIVDGQEMH